MVRGRKPKPTAKKKLEGNPGKRPLPENEPQPTLLDGTPLCPKHLKGVARSEWNRVAPELSMCSILTLVELSLLEQYCQAVARARKFQTVFDKITMKDLEAMTEAHDKQKIRLLISAINQATTEARATGSELGITPSARARMGDGGTGITTGTSGDTNAKPGSDGDLFDF